MWTHYNPDFTLGRALPYQTLRKCPLTQNNGKEKELFQIKHLQLFNDTDGRNEIVHRVVYNEESGMIYTNPAFTKEGMDVLFAPAGRSYGSGLHAASQANWVMNHCPGIRRVMDIGCGNGAFLKEMPDTLVKFGFDTLTLPSPDSGIYYLPIEYLQNVPSRADTVITMFHVLEHLPHPMDFLVKLYHSATTSTRLVIEVPVLENIRDNEDIVGFFSVQHMTHFSKNSLRALLSAAGWRINEEADCLSHNGFRVVAIPAYSRPYGVRDKELDFAAATAYVKRQSQSIMRISNMISSTPCRGNTLVWGAGQHTGYMECRTSLFWKLLDARYLITDNDPAKQGGTFKGIPIIAPQDICWNEVNRLVISSYAHQNEIIAALPLQVLERVDIITLYDPAKVIRY